MIYESTRKMTPNEQMAYDLGYNKAKAESAAQLAAVQAEIKRLRLVENEISIISQYQELSAKAMRGVPAPSAESEGKAE